MALLPWFKCIDIVSSYSFTKIILISGSGSILLVDSNVGGLSIVKRFEWNDALFDVTWSENNEHIAVTGSGDGSIQVWDFAQQQV